MIHRFASFHATAALIVAVLLLGAVAPVAGQAPADQALDAATSHEAFVADLARRRQAVLEAIGDDGVLLLYSLKPAHFSNDVNFEYRQENNLFYLTGIAHPNAALLVSGRALPEVGHFVLFADINDNGGFSFSNRRLSTEEAARQSGLPATSIRSTRELADVFQEAVGMKRASKPMIGGKRTLYYDYRRQDKMGSARGRKIREWVTAIRKTRKGRRKVRPASRMVSPLRVIKSDYEIACLRRAIKATEAGLAAAVKNVRPGKHEYEIEALIEFQYRSRGCARSAFPSIVGAGRNSCIPHYDLNRDRMRDGDVVVMDVGGEFNHYAADITRTIPVNGTFSDEQRTLYNLVYRAQRAGIAAVKPGASFMAAHHAAAQIISDGLLELGYIKKRGHYRRYFMHGTSHTLGMDVHDVSTRGKLRPGMVLTVEPGIYITEKKIGIRIEDDVLVTEKGHEILSAAVPTRAEELERMMATPAGDGAR